MMRVPSALRLSFLFCLVGLGCAAKRAQDTPAAQTVQLTVEQTTLRCPGGHPDSGTSVGVCKVVATETLNETCSLSSAYGMPPGEAHACGEEWDECKGQHTYAVACDSQSGPLSCSCQVDGLETSAFIPAADFCEYAGTTEDGQVWIQNCKFHTTLILD